MKIYLTLILTLFVLACSESSNNSESSIQSPDNSAPDGGGTSGTVVMAQLALEPLGNLTAKGSLSVKATMTDLGADDAIYLHVESPELEQAKLLVEPKDAMIYPTNKTAEINFLFKDNGVLGSALVTVKLVTSSGQVIVKELDLVVSE